ncbi:prepilin-type N-terminal cleavage/methylation domain-containing protein [Xylanimonas ulmi]|uniref:Prepilin-type N-terminal cleavage/methylation domain-containing protein n=1 Tax=Xylanimonas ulmi TaxID=228973 RepID=A0A4Q7M4G0_9MICO|nr:prepilin-type N-terminal cleavage/methylation domain-containing protein [Xylanibacterium ulmi]RZS61522.1 prepilin-type N-terminal cleavage/methylation domain-containing protein [Xylanibacterium ulmi]
MRQHHHRPDKEAGFSLVELLVVIIIIGILAAIAIPLFLNQRQKAYDTAAKSDVSTLGKEIATLWVDNSPTSITVTIDGTSYQLDFVVDTGTKTLDVGPVSNGVKLEGSDTGVSTFTVVPEAAGPLDRMSWCVGVIHPRGQEKNWKYTASGGLSAGTCTA